MAYHNQHFFFFFFEGEYKHTITQMKVATLFQDYNVFDYVFNHKFNIYLNHQITVLPK